MLRVDECHDVSADTSHKKYGIEEEVELGLVCSAEN